MSQLINTSLFDPICQYIKLLRSDGYIEIEIPPELQLDFDSIRAYFKDDAVLTAERGAPMFIKGTIKNSSMVDYLMEKHFKMEIKWV